MNELPFRGSMNKPAANTRLSAAAPALLRSLERCAFLLERIAEGDHRALQNSLDAVEQARKVIVEAGGVFPGEEVEA
jgi:hypothetical protein